MGIASVVLLSSIFCIWLAGMLRAARVIDSEFVDLDH